MRRLLTVASISLASLAVLVSPAKAEYPDRPVKMMIGFAPGGGADLLARWYATKLQEVSKGTFIVENKPGASGNLAADAVAKAKPDGYTILFASSVSAGNPYVYKDLPFDVNKDLFPITSYAETPFVLVVGGQSPVNTVAELTESLKAKPGKGKYGWATTVTLSTAVIYASTAGLDVTPVGYKITANAISDVTGGLLDFGFADIIFSSGQAKQNRVKILGVTSATRAAGLPDIPSLVDLGYGTGDITPVWGVWGPAGVPKEVVDKLTKWVNEITAMPATREFLVSQGATPMPGAPDAYKKKIEESAKSWAKVTSIAKIEPQ